MKSYTDIEQSKKLAEILPIESSDTFYKRSIGDSCNWERHFKNLFELKNHPTGVGFLLKKKIIVPAWSLSALLGVLPSVIKRKGKRMFLTLEKAGAYNLYYKSPDRMDEFWETNEEPVDACYEMILLLNKEGEL